MPGLDYLGESPYESRMEKNAFYNPFMLFGFDIGLSVGGSVLNKSASKMGELVSNALVPYEPKFAAMSAKAKPLQGSKIFRHPTEAGRYLNVAEENIGKFKWRAAYGKRMKRIAKAFGIVGMFQFGYDIASILSTVGESTKMSRDQIVNTSNDIVRDQDRYLDSRAAFTQRQRALQVIHNSRLSLRPMLGNEANYLHY